MCIIHYKNNLKIGHGFSSLSYNEVIKIIINDLKGKNFVIISNTDNSIIYIYEITE